MKFKKILALLCAAALVGTLGFTVLVSAADSGENDGESVSRWFRFPWGGSGIEDNLTDEQKAEIEDKVSEIQSILDSALTDEQRAAFESRAGKGAFGFPFSMPELTDEQKAEMEARWADKASRWTAQRENWDALTDEMREELYSLQDKTVEAQIAVIEKYLELGVIDEETAKNMIDRLNEGQSVMRESGRMPMMGGRGMRGGKSFGGR